MHQSHFHIHASQATSTRKARYSIIHRIRTSQTLSTIRNYHSIFSLLKKHHCYLRTHSWPETVWDVRQAGYVIGIDPKHYTSETASHLVADIIAKATTGKCPPIRMIYTSQRIQIGDRNISSKVYAIEFERQHSKEIMQKIKLAFSGSTKFLMAKLRFSHPEAFANALKIQNQMMIDTSFIPMTNVSKDEYFYLQPMIESITGVKAVVQTRTTTTKGRYHILVQSKLYKEVRAKLIQGFETIYSDVPDDAKQKPHAFLFSGPPGILPRNDEDDESSGVLSFLSTSAASFASIDTSNFADEYVASVPASGTYSWSQIAQRKSPTSIPKEVTTPATVPTEPAASSAFSVITSSDRQSPASEIQQMRDDYEDKLNKNATEIAELKTMLTNVLATLNSMGFQPDQSSGTAATQSASVTTEIMGSQKRGVNESPLADSGRQKRADHKSSPSKANQMDFC
jgi:hypothetical protein